MDYKHGGTKMKVYKNVLEMIGDTPIVKLNKLNSNKSVEIYLKLEGQNPGGSVKDRIALRMIEAAEKERALTKDKTILEATSGNTGIGLALVSIVKGYKIILTMSGGMSEERKRMLRALGAKLVLTDPEKGTDGAIMRAHEMMKQNPDKYWMPNQFDNPNNVLAHYVGTAEEILKQMPDITMFVAGMGTSGTLIGVSMRLKEENPQIEIVGVEPILNHKIAGLKNMKEAIVPKIYDESKLDTKIIVNDKDAYETARKLAKEGIFVGMSSGAAVFAALEKAKTLKKGKIVIISADRGEKYLSTELFNE